MHNHNIINLLKLERINFDRLEERRESILLFFKKIDERTPCLYGYTKLHIHDWGYNNILDYFTKKTNALAEKINNKIKVIKRQSYGIRKFDNLRNLLMLRISWSPS